ncbi:hypothetical protein [Pimelobacter simplex]|uniref:hypothetical protein n=1 Tax=Nocardioides simplex TaxID=2045 RepID=UPI001375AC9B|nr:hypothetical protein [Pimelobacter simplex]
MTATTQPSPRALATASLTKATRLTGEARREALTKHAAMVWPSKSCTLTAKTSRF